MYNSQKLTVNASSTSLFVLISHYKNTPMQHAAIFHGRKNDNLHLIFFFTIFILLLKTEIVGTRLNHLNEAVLTSTHNLCFRAKIRK